MAEQTMEKLHSTINIDGTEYEVVAKTAEKLANGLKVTVGVNNEAKSFTFNGEKEEEILIPTVGDFTYSNSTPTVNALGGVAAGVTFDNVPITDMLTKILYPYIAPVISSTSRNVPAAILECGASQTLSSATINVVKKSNPITSIELLNGTKSLGSKTGDTVANGGEFSFNFEAITVSASNNPNLKFKVTDGKSSIERNIGASTFVYPYYYGAIGANTTISEAVVEELTKKIESKGNKAWTFTLNNQKAVFAYPKTYGALKEIIDANNFTVTDTFTRSELSITGLDGTAQIYYVYVSNGASTLSDFKYTFNI
jgi:hypothetical protein